MDIKILVATHKKYQMPKDDIYIPIHVGKEGKEELGYIGDNTGDNISDRNSFFNEMTGIYWAWKNVSAEYIGLVHYRRYFTNASFIQRTFSKNKDILIIKECDIQKYLKKGEVILPYKRKYYIETIESHYKHLPYTIDDDLEMLKKVVHNNCPEYDYALEKVLHRRWAHMFNIFIMKKNIFDRYCNWVFPILFEVDKNIMHEGRTEIQDRLYISEFMIDTWLEVNSVKYIEMPIVFLEGENMIKKAAILVKRKFGKK